VGKDFLEKDFYIDPPNLPKDATDKEVEEAWKNWDKQNSKLRANDKRRWTISQQPGEMYNPDTANILVKINGVWKQSSHGIEGTEEAYSIVAIEKAKQDKHYKARGNRGKKKGNKHKKRRNDIDKKIRKKQLILSDGKNDKKT